ncbi:MAG: hypothetical protein GX591_05985, partial [Planctomycetes bacterium]|nr:hypothetical protein [Planctomycetota bacterium]
IGPSSDYFKEGLLLVGDKRAQLEKLLKENTYDGFVFLATSPAAWPKDLQYWLTARLLEGAGIAVLGNDSTWGLPGRGEADDELTATIPRDAMTRAVPSTNGVYRNHLGDPMPPLERIEIPLEVPPVRRFTLGKGRYDVFSVRHTGGYIATAISPQAEMPPDELFQAEYFCGLSCRIVLDALGRLPERRLLRVEAPGAPLPPATAGEVTLLTAGPRPFAGTVRRVLRDRWGRVQASGTQKVAVTAGTNHIALAVPPLDAGDYYADAWLLDGTKVVDWASARFTVRACDGGPCRCNPSCRSLLPAPALQEISFVHRTIGPGEALAATVTVAHATSATTLRAEIRDIRGRVTERVGGITAAGGAAGIVLPSSRLWHTFQNLDVFLEQDGRVLDRRSHTFFYRHPERDDYAIFTDSDATGRILDHRQEILRGYGIQLFQGNGAPELLAKGGDITTRFWLSGSNNRTGGSLASDAYHRGVAATFRHIATQLRERNGRFVSTGDDSGVASDFASNYPNWIPPFFRRIRQKYEAAGVGAAEYRRQRGLPGGGNSFFWWMDSVNVPELVSMKLQPGDLRDFTDAFREAYRTIEEFNHANGTAFASWAAITEETLPRIKPALAPDVIGFQNWLRNKYGEIARLNAAWGVQTNSFAAIDPKLVADQTEKGVFAPAIDKTTYLEDLFIRHMKSVAEAVHAVDPTIGIGQGAASFGNIVPEVLAHTDTIIPYIGPLDIELARALPHKWVGETIGIYGGKKVPDAMRRKQVWHGLFTGCNFSWFWSACIAGLHGDLTTNPGRSGVMLESYREVTRGPDALLLRGRRLNDGIAILHSRSSGHMTPHAQEMSTHA